ncbi:MAG: isoprenylcysteine carboxylmethyltransferase family protein, partial [Methyloceanibacter sp.]
AQGTRATDGGWRMSQRSLAVLDLAERILVALLYGYFAFRMLAAPSAKFNIVTLVLLVSESLPVIFIVSRLKARALSGNPMDWLLGTLGASLPLLASRHAAHSALVPLQVCVVIMLAGLWIEISAKLALGRRFGIVAANRGIEISGPYRFVRHPMYVGYTIVHIGFLMAFPSLWNATLYSTELLIQLARLLREERLLKQDAGYREYASRVPYRVLPMIF